MTDPDSDGRESPPVDYAAMLEARVIAVSSKRDSLRGAISEMREARSLTFADDEHDPDGSTTSLDQARDSALLQQTERILAELSAARERLVDGSFGRCERCGEPIAAARLEARPEARYCVDCSRAASGRSRS